MAKVITFGELMIRLQPYNYERFVQADSLAFTFGGGEANVAVSLANFGFESCYVTKLPAQFTLADIMPVRQVFSVRQSDW